MTCKLGEHASVLPRVRTFSTTWISEREDHASPNPWFTAWHVAHTFANEANWWSFHQYNGGSSWLNVLTRAKEITMSSTLQKSRFGSFTQSLRAKVSTAQQKKKIVTLVKAGAVLPVAAGILRRQILDCYQTVRTT